MAGINTAIDLKQDGRTIFKIDSIYINVDKENNLKEYEYILSDEQGVLKVCDCGSDLRFVKDLKRGEIVRIKILDEYTAIFLRNDNHKYSEDDIRSNRDYYYNYNIKIKKAEIAEQFLSLAKEYNKISNEKLNDIAFDYDKDKISLELNKNVYYDL